MVRAYESTPRTQRAKNPRGLRFMKLTPSGVRLFGHGSGLRIDAAHPTRQKSSGASVHEAHAFRGEAFRPWFGLTNRRRAPNAPKILGGFDSCSSPLQG